jgi:glucokinase
MSPLLDEMNKAFTALSGDTLPRLEISAYNLEEDKSFNDFTKDTSVLIKVPFSEKMVNYDPVKKVGVGISKLGTSRAVAIGAYAFALNELSGM